MADDLLAHVAAFANGADDLDFRLGAVGAFLLSNEHGGKNGRRGPLCQGELLPRALHPPSGIRLNEINGLRGEIRQKTVKTYKVGRTVLILIGQIR